MNRIPNHVLGLAVEISGVGESLNASVNCAKRKRLNESLNLKK
jgi:hypothetical protein